MTQRSAQILGQRSEQRQTLSQLQLLCVRLLELPIEAIEERIRTEVLENPALEEIDSGETDELNSETSGDELTLGDYRNEDDIPDYLLGEGSGVGKRMAAEDIPLTDTVSFYEVLKGQLGECDLDDGQQAVAEYLIGSLDGDGLLRKPLSTIVDELMLYQGVYMSEREVEKVLGIVQQLEPAGVGARGLKECLVIQLKRKSPSSSRDTALDIMEKCYEDFTYKRWERIKQRLNLSDEKLQEAIDELVHLNPRPGSSVGEAMDKRWQQITPDFIVETDSDGNISFGLNERNVPRLQVSQSFSAMAKECEKEKKENKETGEALVFLKQKIDAAQGFIDAVRQRQITLIATMQAIVEIQHAFFLEGDERLLKPMKLKDVAQRTGLDISTVSRVSNCKYVQTDYGVFPLKFFFGDSFHKPTAAIQKEVDGTSVAKNEEETSLRLIRAVIRECIDNEDKQNPLTDEQLVKILQQHGFDIARRTVAKHRSQLGIPVARMRK